MDAGSRASPPPMAHPTPPSWSSTSWPRRTGRIVGWTALTVALGAAAVVLLPLPPELLSFIIDDSFGATLHYVAASGQGSEMRLISTYGPLGFVYYPIYLPETFRWLVILQAAFGAVIAWGLVWVGRVAWGSPWGAAFLVAGTVPLFGPPDVRFWMLPLLAVLVELPVGRRAPTALRLALGAAIGAATLIKITFLVNAAVVLVPLGIADLLVRRRAPLPALSAGSTILIAWLALGLGWTDWLSYLDWSLREITPGYSPAMQVPTTPGLVLHAVVVSLALLLAGALLAWHRTRATWWASAFAMAGLLFGLFKAGFVRADAHVLLTSFGLLAGALALAVLSVRSPQRIAVALLLVVVLPGSLLWHALAFHGMPNYVLFAAVSPTAIVDRLRSLPKLLFSDALAQAHTRRIAEMRATHPVPMQQMPGTVDVYPYHQSVLLAYGAEFRPRPVFQSYMAYTPRLAHANAEFLESERAPRWILFTPATIDGRFPTLDDAAVWPLLLSRYRLADEAEPFAILERRSTPLSWRLVPLGRAETTTDTAIAVPSGLVWARIDVHETLGDRVVSTLFTGPYVWMDVTGADGRVERYRLVPAIARDGFLLSPVIGDTQNFMTLMQRGAGGLSERTLRSLTVHVTSPFENPCGPRTVGVEFFQLVIGD